MEVERAEYLGLVLGKFHYFRRRRRRPRLARPMRTAEEGSGTAVTVKALMIIGLLVKFRVRLPEPSVCNPVNSKGVIGFGLGPVEVPPLMILVLV